MDKKLNNRKSRHSRVRAKVRGTKDVPRVSVFRSNSHLYIQVIDDTSGKTLASANDTKLKVKGSKTEITQKLAKTVCEIASKAGISKVVFDRGGYKYHGRVKALAEELRKNGLKF